MTLPSMRSELVGREFLRVAGGYGVAAVGASPAGGLDVDNAGNLATDGDVTLDGDLAVAGGAAVTGDVAVEGDVASGGGYGSGGVTVDSSGQIQAAGSVVSNGLLQVSNANPKLYLTDSDGGTDHREWNIRGASGGVLRMRAENDALAAATDFMVVVRDATYGIDSIMFKTGSPGSPQNALNIDSAQDARFYGDLDVDGATTMAGNLDVGGDLVVATKTPSTNTDTGSTGTIAWDASFVYVCTATNNWKRAAIATW